MQENGIYIKKLKDCDVVNINWRVKGESMMAADCKSNDIKLSVDELFALAINKIDSFDLKNFDLWATNTDETCEKWQIELEVEPENEIAILNDLT